MSALPPPGLYAITDSRLTRERGLSGCVEAALRGGAVMVQYRDKESAAQQRLSDARELVRLCHRYRVPLIVNDDVDLAHDAGADGVHLGRDDASVADARARLGASAIVGVSCYHELDRALAGAADGADYVAFGRFFSSRTKPGQALATPALTVIRTLVPST